MIKEYRTALVTGASRGVGPYIVRALIGAGMNLVLAARNAVDLSRVANEVSTTSARAIAVPTDLTDQNALRALVTCAEEELGTIDVLVNNAALDSLMPFHKEQPELIERMLLTNLSAPLILTRLVLPGMLERRRGHIVNIASLAAKIPFPYDAVYATSKAGLAHFTASLRAEYRGTGVTASLILPGQFTDIGLSAQGLKEAGVARPKSVPTSAPETIGQAILSALRRDRPEVAIPEPALLFAQIPPLGTLFLKGTGASAMLKEAAENRGRALP